MRGQPIQLPVEPGPTVGGALDRVVDAAQNVVADQIGLARLEIVTALRNLLRNGVLVLLGGLLLLGAWATLSMAVYELLAPYLMPVERLGIITAVHAVIGGGLLTAGLRRGG